MVGDCAGDSTPALVSLSSSSESSKGFVEAAAALALGEQRGEVEGEAKRVGDKGGSFENVAVVVVVILFGALVVEVTFAAVAEGGRRVEGGTAVAAAAGGSEAPGGELGGEE